MSSCEFWSPYLFEEEDKALSVTPTRNVQMLQNFLKPKLQEFGENATVWFQQDRATARTAKKLIDIL